MRKAVIDIGTNSVRLILAERDGDEMRILRDEGEITRLGEGLGGGEYRLGPEAVERSRRTVEGFAKRARRDGAGEVRCVGTMALRSAANSDDFAALLRDTCGLERRTLTGEEEARLSYLAVLFGLKPRKGELTVFDAGGGSTEFIHGRGEEIRGMRSIELGAVEITERFFTRDPVDTRRLEDACREIRDRLAPAAPAPGSYSGDLVGMGGTVTTLGAVKHGMDDYDPELIHGSGISRREVREQIGLYAAMTIAERKRIPGLHPKRAEVILAGACIVEGIMEIAGAGELIISDRGLRHGLLYEMLFEKYTSEVQVSPERGAERGGD